MRWTHNALAPMGALWCPLRGFSGGVTLELYSGGYSLRKRLKDPMSWELKGWTTSVCRKWSQEWLYTGKELLRWVVKWSKRVVSASKVVSSVQLWEVASQCSLEVFSTSQFLIRALLSVSGRVYSGAGLFGIQC